MDEHQYLWDHFKFNAEQRLKAFHFFVLLSIFADGGVFAALEKQFASGLLILLGTFILLLSFAFLLIDTRSTQLLKLTESGLIENGTAAS